MNFLNRKKLDGVIIVTKRNMTAPIAYDFIKIILMYLLKNQWPQVLCFKNW